MKQRTAKEAYYETQNGRQLTKFQQWRYDRKLKAAKKLIMKRAFELVDDAVGEGKHEVKLNVHPLDHYKEKLVLFLDELVPAIPNFFSEYEKNKIHTEVLEYMETAFKSFGYEVEITDVSRSPWVKEVVSQDIRLYWSGKYGDACGES